MTRRDLDIDLLLQPLGPFERPPVIAAAVSGGSDSTALGLLLAEWVAAHNGRLHVLSVDHGLRPEAREECAAVARRFAALPGCGAEILAWTGAKPSSGLQQAAREARYRLLAGWCRARGILHLALGHTADDQAETVAMRAAHGSTEFGLAGMAAVQARDGVRLLRPLLGVRREELRAWLRARGEGWVEDPSNTAQNFERVRQRGALAASGETGAWISRTMEQGRARDRIERQAACWLAAAGRVDPAGFLELDLAAWDEAPAALRVAMLRQALLAMGGHAYPAAPEALQRVAGGVGGQTLAGCRVLRRGKALLICREAGDIRAPVPVVSGWRGAWDGRFDLEIDHMDGDGFAVGALGLRGQRLATRQFGLSLKRYTLPEPVRAALPALWRGEQLLAQPHLGLGTGLRARFAPHHRVTTCGFTVAASPPHTIYSSFPG